MIIVLKVWTIGMILLLIATISFGQKSSDNASKKICKCVEDKIPIITDNLHLKDSVNACFGQGMAAEMEGLRKEYRVKGNGITVEQVREMRDRLWRKLERECEQFKKAVAGLETQ
jgi:hypothetical protein